MSKHNVLVSELWLAKKLSGLKPNMGTRKPCPTAEIEKTTATYVIR
jgi:hypothetical protein